MTLPRATSVLALDDRAALAVHPLDARLAGAVGSLWTLSVDDPPARLRVIPDGQIDLIFDLDGAAAYVGGASSEPFEVTHARPTHLLGVALVPGAAAAFLGVPAGDLAPHWRPLASVVGPVADALARRVADAPDLPARLALVEAFLLARLGRTDARVDRAVRAIADSDGRVDVARLGRQSGASPRNLSRLFHAWVGLGPKRLARIVRAQAALRRLAAPDPPDLAALAAELGYADHAHLTRELRAVLGEAPTALAETFKRQADSFKR